MTQERVVANRFELLDVAGSGGMASVYRARDRETGAIVALKLLHARDDDFEGEARLLQELAQPGVVRYVAHGRGSEGAYLVMEWLEGEDLEQRLARAPLTRSEAVDVVRRVAEALTPAHRRGVVHRDIKPANLWLTGRDLTRVKLLDFGVAHALTTTLQAVTSAVVGTPSYMAPEQIRGTSSLDARADVYSLGCVLFECLTGHAPFVAYDIVALLAKTLLEEAPRLAAAMPGAPPELDDLLARMLAKEPAKRPASAESLLREPAFATPGAAIAHEVVAPAPAPAPSLTSREQRIASVILFGVTRAEDATVATDSWSEAIANARAVVSSFDARIEVMIGGSVAVLVEGRGGATDEARRAASCALALQRATGVPVMALATGRAELDTVMIGPAVDRAAALLRDATGGLRIDEVTAALLGEDFDVARGVLVGRREVDESRSLLGKRTPTVGRDRELERLDRAFARCRDDSRARAALVTGPAGMGKSRVRQEMLRRWSARPVQVWSGRADSVGAGAAFGLAAQLVRRAAGVFEGEPLTQTHDKLRRRVERHVPAGEVPRVACFLAEMIGAPFEAAGDVALETARREPMVMSDQIRLAWEDFVAAECAASELVVVLDDLQWGDRPTINLCDAALRSCRDKALFIVAFGRPEVNERFPDLFAGRDFERIALEALPDSAAQQLVRQALDERATPEIIQRLVERGAGNAFYLEELVRAVADGRSDTPESALLMVQSRLEAIEPEARRVLRAASVFGRTFWEGGIAALLGDGAQARAWLRKLEERELVHRHGLSRFAGERELVFDHSLVQEAAYAMLISPDAALGHKLAAKWLESAGETHAVVLAEHWAAAGESTAARAWWARAAQQALDGNDYAECIARAERGVLEGARGSELARLRDLQAEAHRWRGENTELAERAREAMNLFPHGSDAWAEAASKLALACQRLGRDAEVASIGEQLASSMAEHASALGLSAGARTASVLALAGKRREAERLLQAVERAAAGVTDPATVARLEQARANRALFEGRAGEYIERSMAAATAFSSAGDRRLACVAHLNVGHGLLELGMADHAASALRKAVDDAERLGLRNLATAAMQNLGWSMFRGGDAKEALQVLRTTVDQFAEQGNKRLAGFSHVYIARILLEAGDVGRAERAAQQGLALAESALPLRVAALAVLAAIHRRAGHSEAAATAAREALAGLDAHGVEDGEGFVRLACASALRQAGAIDEADRALALARSRLEARAAGIHRDDWRASFLRVAEHAETMGQHNPVS